MADTTVASNKFSDEELSDSFSFLLGMAKKAAQNSLLTSQRSFSDSDLSTPGLFFKARRSKKRGRSLPEHLHSCDVNSKMFYPSTILLT